MQATQFEFKNRFWIIGSIFSIGFACFYFDIGTINALRHLLAPSLAPKSAAAENFTRGVIFFGALLVFGAALVRTWGNAYLRTEVVHDTEQHAEALVADGPFRFTRNPLYLANLPMAAGIGLLAPRAGCLFIIAGNWFFVYRLIFREEAGLRQTQGESYRDYCRLVPRFWPALTPRLPASGRAPRWGQAFAGEMFIWLFGLGELVTAITLNLQLGLIVFSLGFVAHFVTIPLVRRAASKRASLGSA